MTGTESLIQDLHGRGVRFAVRNKRLVVDAPEEALTDQVVRSLRANKTEIVALLTHAQPATVAKLQCYSCRSRRFWKSIYGQVICAICHPPAATHLVDEWIDAEPPIENPWFSLGYLTDEEVQARVAYLRGLDDERHHLHTDGQP